jgi:hypothetical protein
MSDDEFLDMLARNMGEKLRMTGAIALLPPLALLGLGAALGWTFRGFRQR